MIELNKREMVATILMFRKRSGHFGVCNGGLMGSFCEPSCIRAQMILDQFVEGAKVSDYGKLRAINYDKGEVNAAIKHRASTSSTGKPTRARPLRVGKDDQVLR